MEYLLVGVCTIAQMIPTIMSKEYNLKHFCGAFKYNLFLIFFAMMFFVATTKNISISSEIIPYSAAFALSYTATTVCSFYAVKYGSLAITSLAISYSLVIPTLYGLIFLKEPLGALKLIGIAILLVSLFLVRGKSEQAERKKITFKWILYLMIAFIGNGMCSTIQNIQRRAFDGVQNGNFMVCSLAIAFVAVLLIVLVYERKGFKEFFPKGMAAAATAGIFNGITNLLVMICTAVVASSVFFPLISAGGVVVAFFVSTLIYKEKFIPRQLMGMCLGIASLVLLNI